MTKAIQRTTAFGLLRFSHDFFDAYSVLKEKNKSLTYQFQAKYFLLGRSLELVLKALLLELKFDLLYIKKIGHDLNLLASVVYYRYRPFPLELKDIAVINMLNEHYLAKDFEYPKIGSKRVPKLDDLEKLLSKIIEVADTNITYKSQ